MIKDNKGGKKPSGKKAIKRLQDRYLLKRYLLLSRRLSVVLVPGEKPSKSDAKCLKVGIRIRSCDVMSKDLSRSVTRSCSGKLRSRQDRSIRQEEVFRYFYNKFL